MSITNKTPTEIKARIERIKGGDWMGTQQSDLIDYLPFEDAKPFLKDGVTASEWDERKVLPGLDAAKEYLSFAWDKANNCRGLSAGRSLDHLKAWLWIAGHGNIVDEHFSNYDHYGKFQLVIASELTGFDWGAADSGEWVGDEDSPSIPQSQIDELVAEAKTIAEQAKAAT